MKAGLVIAWIMLLVLGMLPGAYAAQRQCVLVEEFTNAGSLPCSTYNPGIRTVMTDMTRDTCIQISYHTWWPGTDPFFDWNPTDAQAKTNYYGVADVPALFVDFGLQPTADQTDSLRSAIRARYAVPSPCTITVSATTVNLGSFRFMASVTADQNMTGGNYRLYVVMTNDTFTYATPPGDNGETFFPQPFRDISPDANNGRAFSIAAGQTFSYAGTLARSNVWPLPNCTVIAYVQNATTREILQAAWAHVVGNPGTISLIAPNGNEQWYAGESHDITWGSSNLLDSIRIDIMRNFPGGVWETIARAVPNTGSYTWLVNAPGAMARIRVSGVARTVVADTSDADFAIGSVTVTAPNSGENFFVGERDTVKWSAPNLAEPVRIELNRNYPSGTWETVILSTANTGSYPWLVTSPLSNNARIRVRGTVHTQVCDTSDANFSIEMRTITVISPNGGEVLTAGQTTTIQWTSHLVPGDVTIRINRNFPNGTWQGVGGAPCDSGHFTWVCRSPGSSNVRIRISSLAYPSVADTSNGNFTINVPNLPPLLWHDALSDIAPGTGTVRAIARDQYMLTAIASVKMFYRLRGHTNFDSLALTATGHPDEFSASLAALGNGSYDYYVRATDDGGLTATVPANAPANLYRFSVYGICSQTLAYDDGSAEKYNWANGPDSLGFLWAVKFGPVTTPFALCGARFAASRSLPDSIHTPVYVAVYAADGPGGMPGTLIYSKVAGSVGNVVGGVPAGTNWAQVTFKDSLGAAPLIRSSQFYIAVGNYQENKYEAFGRDTTGANSHRSYFFDPCRHQWFSEDDSGINENAHPGNRMIRALGSSYSLTALRNGNDIVLRWANLAAPHYRVYSSDNAGGPFNTLEGVSNTNSYTIVNGANTNTQRFYEVYPDDN